MIKLLSVAKRCLVTKQIVSFAAKNNLSKRDDKGMIKSSNQGEISTINKSASSLSEEQFSKEYRMEHYSKRKAVNDVIESIYFSDHSEQMQYQFLKNIQQNKEGKEEQEKEELEISNGEFNQLMDLSSSAKTAIFKEEKPYNMVPETSEDLVAIINGIHLNNHLLNVFVKYQKQLYSLIIQLMLIFSRLFQTFTYSTLINQLKKNVDNLDAIKEIETAKYEKKRKALQKINPQAKLKYKPVFLDANDTKEHFGYPLLLRNLKQKIAKCKIWRALSLVKQLSHFDSIVSEEFFTILASRFKEEKETYQVNDLIHYLQVLVIQCQQRKSLINKEEQREVMKILWTKEKGEYNLHSVNQIVKLRLISGQFSLPSLSTILQNIQVELTRNVTQLTTKQILELAAVALNDKIKLHKFFAEILFITILKNLPQEPHIKAKIAIAILSHFKDQKLRYNLILEKEEKDILSPLKIWTNNSESNNQTKQDLESSESGVLIVDGLFDGLMSAIIQEISKGEKLKLFQLNQLLQVLLDNQITKQSHYEIVISEYYKQVNNNKNKNEGLISFCKTYNCLSDYQYLSQPLHAFTANKLKQVLTQEFVKYDVLQDKLLPFNEQHLIIQNQKNIALNSDKMFPSEDNYQLTPKLASLLVGRLGLCVMNAWSYSLNCVRFEVSEKIDLDMLAGFVGYANSLIEDINRLSDDDIFLFASTLRQIYQINTFISLKAKNNVPKIKVSKLYNVHLRIGDKQNESTDYIQQLFDQQRKYFEIKYSPYLKQYAEQQDKLFDCLIVNPETAMNTAFNYIDNYSYSNNQKERGITYLNRHFADLMKVPSLEVHIDDFEDYLINIANSKEEAGHSKNIVNFIESVIGEDAFPQLTQIPKEVQDQLNSIEKEVETIYNKNKETISKKTLKQQKVVAADNNLVEETTNKYYTID